MQNLQASSVVLLIFKETIDGYNHSCICVYNLILIIELLKWQKHNKTKNIINTIYRHKPLENIIICPFLKTWLFYNQIVYVNMELTVSCIKSFSLNGKSIMRMHKLMMYVQCTYYYKQSSTFYRLKLKFTKSIQKSKPRNERTCF